MVSTSKPTVKPKPALAARERDRRSRKVPVQEIGSDGSAVQKAGDPKMEKEKRVELIDCGCESLCKICMRCQCTNHVICDYDGTAEANEHEMDDNEIPVDGPVQWSEEDEDLTNSEYGDMKGTASKTMEKAYKASKGAYKAAKKARKAARKAYRATGKGQMASRRALGREAKELRPPWRVQDG